MRPIARLFETARSTDSLEKMALSHRIDRTPVAWETGYRRRVVLLLVLLKLVLALLTAAVYGLYLLLASCG
jgi:ABC-type uncharacterized transport system YnjBCD ATPase subunit